MTRSIWKGPFVDGYLLKKAEVARGSGRMEYAAAMFYVRDARKRLSS